jgi:hypothetical protein
MDGYSRNASCALNCISTFLFICIKLNRSTRISWLDVYITSDTTKISNIIDLLYLDSHYDLFQSLCHSQWNVSHSTIIVCCFCGGNHFHKNLWRSVVVWCQFICMGLILHPPFVMIPNFQSRIFSVIDLYVNENPYFTPWNNKVYIMASTNVSKIDSLTHIYKSL